MCVLLPPHAHFQDSNAWESTNPWIALEQLMTDMGHINVTPMY